MDANRVEINPGPGGIVVVINNEILAGATVVFVDGQRLDFIDGRVVVSTVAPDDPALKAKPDVPAVRRIAL